MASTLSNELQVISNPHARSSRASRDAEAVPVGAPSTEIEMQALPPADHGREAYLVLAGCSLIQAPVWGEQCDI